MHDPKTVAHEIRIKSWYLLTIWHVDPESDRTDDSCGWSRPWLTDKEEKIISDVVDWEKDFPYYSSPYLTSTQVNPKYSYSQMLAGDCLAHVAGAWQHIAWQRDRRKKLTTGEWWGVVALATNPDDNLRSILADTEVESGDRIKYFFSCVMNAYLRHHRPWYQHPRWHIRHWEFQVHPIQRLKRWLFSRCAHCGKRFRYGYAPTSTWGGSGGPRWFSREKNVFHRDCYSLASKMRNKNLTGE